MSDERREISRVTRSKEQARASYNGLSKWYDTLSGRFEKKYGESGLQMLHARSGEKILELGFGTGNGILALSLTVGEQGRVCGVDISEGMCAIARAKIKKADISGRVNLLCADAADLPLKQGVFDAVFMSFALELFDTPEIPLVLSECRRVLKDAGRICVVTMSKKDRDGLMVKLYEWFHRTLPKQVDCRPIFARKAFEEAGFSIQDVNEMSMWGLPVEIVLARK